MNIKKIFLDWGVPIIAAVILALLINKFVLFNIEIPSGSMIPTINVGDRLIATRIYNYENIKRGDILVFQSNYEDKLYIKRVIGLPGDKIKIDAGDVYVNGKKLEEEYVKNTMETYGEYYVPDDSYFFLGDNRSNSDDSRMWLDPYIKQESIKGKAQVRVYPFSDFGSIK